MGPSVRIVPAGPEHAERVQELVDHPDVLGPTSMPEPYPEGGARRFLEQTLRRRAEGTDYVFAIMAAPDGLVGLVGLARAPAGSDRAELGYWVGRAYWGRGYATAAVGMAIDAAFGDLGLVELVARALAENERSRRVLERNGFTLEGFGSHDVAKWPASAVLANYRLTRDAWSIAARGAAPPAVGR